VLPVYSIGVAMPRARTSSDSAGGSERTMTAGEAARALGVSVDTLRRWDREGRIRTTRDDANRRRVPASEVERLAGRMPKTLTGSQLSARNRLAGVVRSVQTDVVMALVEIEAGPYLLAAAITRDAVEELGLVAGVPVVATIKATSVMVSREEGPGR
jgi:molybdopterin-binding protein